MVSFHHPDGLPSQFTIHFAVLLGEVIGIIKGQDGCFEADAMFPPIDPVLPLIPGETQYFIL